VDRQRPVAKSLRAYARMATSAATGTVATPTADPLVAPPHPSNERQQPTGHLDDRDVSGTGLFLEQFLEWRRGGPRRWAGTAACWPTCVQHGNHGRHSMSAKPYKAFAPGECALT
jgi:hypothetical protein